MRACPPSRQVYTSQPATACQTYCCQPQPAVPALHRRCTAGFARQRTLPRTYTCRLPPLPRRSPLGALRPAGSAGRSLWPHPPGQPYAHICACVLLLRVPQGSTSAPRRCRPYGRWLAGAARASCFPNAELFT